MLFGMLYFTAISRCVFDSILNHRLELGVAILVELEPPLLPKNFTSESLVHANSLFNRHSQSAKHYGDESVPVSVSIAAARLM